MPAPLFPIDRAPSLAPWRAGVMAAETWASALATIALRQQLWLTQPPTSLPLLDENQRMVTEKWEAGVELAAVWHETWVDACTGRLPCWWESSQRILHPLHRRTMANSRRLTARPPRRS
ncbi:hypothetical protein KGQ91_06295 [Modicisalibacter tunisiensis]|uniref:Uncharacterized protein n=2 Tax=Halomonadaceae TaxID=28256 RepID=A0ABS7WYK4_9GAMM|nr:hypothetical protein [Modicisalibacter tunisiensis]